MSYKKICLNGASLDDHVRAQVEGRTQATPEDFDPELLITDGATVYKPNGEVLLTFLPRAIELEHATTAFQQFIDAPLNHARSSNRPAIAGSYNDGAEGVLGFMDRVHRFNFCRATALSAKHMEGFKASLPFIRSTSELFRQHQPERYQAQLAACDAAHPDYKIPGTCYSTVTINRNTTAVYHTDKGDYKPGMGVIAATWATPGEDGWEVVTENPVEGGILVFPKYRVAVQLRTQDLLLCDVHEVHGVTAITAPEGTWTRMSFVFYFRENIGQCGSLKEEVERVNRMDTEKYFGKPGGSDEDASADE